MDDRPHIEAVLAEPDDLAAKLVEPHRCGASDFQGGGVGRFRAGRVRRGATAVDHLGDVLRVRGVESEGGDLAKAALINTEPAEGGPEAAQTVLEVGVAAQSDLVFLFVHARFNSQITTLIIC